MRHLSRLLLVLCGSLLVQLAGSACGVDGVSFAPGDAGAGEAEARVVACDQTLNGGPGSPGAYYAEAVIEADEATLMGVRAFGRLAAAPEDLPSAYAVTEAPVIIGPSRVAVRCGTGILGVPEAPLDFESVTFVVPAH